MPQTDPARLTADLIRCPSVTPEEGGALVLLEAVVTRIAEGGWDKARKRIERWDSLRLDIGEISDD